MARSVIINKEIRKYEFGQYLRSQNNSTTSKKKFDGRYSKFVDNSIFLPKIKNLSSSFDASKPDESVIRAKHMA